MFVSFAQHRILRLAAHLKFLPDSSLHSCSTSASSSHQFSQHCQQQTQQQRQQQQQQQHQQHQQHHQTQQHQQLNTSSVSVEEAILSRKSVRGFLKDVPVPRTTMEALLNLAARAPSDNNIQQWQVYVVQGETRDAMCRAALAERQAQVKAGNTQGYRAIPPNEDGSSPARVPLSGKYPETYELRKRMLGRLYYRHIKILGDRKLSEKQQEKNYDMFGAPVGLFFFTDLDYLNSWRDCGMFINTLMLAARGRGLHTIALGAWAHVDQTVRQFTGAPDSQTLICGMGLGYEDPNELANSLQTPRESLEKFVKFVP